MSSGVGNGGVREPAQRLGARDQPRAAQELVELRAREQLAVAGPELVGIRRQVPVEGDEPATGLERGPRGADRRDGVRQLVERVLEVGQRRLALVSDGGDVPVLDGDPVGQDRCLDGRAGPGHGIRLELDPGQRRAREAAGHRDQPAAATAVDVEDPRAGLEVDHELRDRRQHLLEEHGDVLDGQPLDGLPVAVGPGRLGNAGPEDLREVPEVEAADGRVEELAAEVLGTVRVEQDARHVLGHPEPVVVELDEVVRAGTPGPAADEGGLRAGPPRQLVRGHARGPGLAQAREQPELQARDDVPRAMEAAEAGDQVVEAIVEQHGCIVARRNRR